MRILQLLNHLDVIQLDVQVLIDRLQRSADLDVVLELDRHLVVDERLEKTVRRDCVRYTCGEIAQFMGKGESART